MSGKKVLVIGSGGREHAICWKLSQSKNVDRIYALPGSYGIGAVNKVENLTNVDAKDFKAIANWCQKSNIDLVIVGPEDPLANGIGDELRKANIKCFGPGKQGAQIESDKKWAKDFMIRHKIPTARYETFTETAKAKQFLKSASYEALVIKASGLAAGKGVVVAANVDEACCAVDEILGQKKYGSAGDVLVIEEKLVGEEVSVLAFVDNSTVRVMLPSQDHKRLKENDEGPNTGGMGAYCPCPLISRSDLEKVKIDVLQRAVDALRKEGIQYCGVLYAGLMLTPDGPKVLEFNCRFGDPETQVILPLLTSDLYEVMLACCDNKLSNVSLSWKTDVSAVGVVMASAKYPESSTKGCVIKGIPANTESQIIFHSGVAVNSSGDLITNGGRVLIAVCLKNDLKLAAAEATKICQSIQFSGAGAQFRTDIAKKAFKLLSLSYKDSGVDIDAGDDLVQRIKPLARGTCRNGVIGGIGGFGGLFNLNELPYKNPILCEVTSGVGTKMKLALDFEMYEGIGQDLVAMCVNSVLESGAEPIAFLDYIACGKLQVPIAAQIIKGISEGCRDANCALLGGETAEMPSVYEVGKYDMAGYSVGVLEGGRDLPKFDKFMEGDLLIGLPSSGFHCSGFESIYELVQKLGLDLNTACTFDNITKTIGQQLLQPSKIYVKDILPLLNENEIKAISHVDGSLINGINKIIPERYEITINAENITIPPIYGWLATAAELSDESLQKVFNCGIGLVFVVGKSSKNWKKNPEAVILGELKTKKTKSESVYINNFDKAVNNAIKRFNNKSSGERSRSLVVVDHENVKSKVDELLNHAQREESFVTQSGKRLTKIPKSIKHPVLVIGTDGVGTKIKIAQKYNLNSTVGIDLVAMCVNDILCNGAEPLTFLSYYACGSLDLDSAKSITSGVIEGAKQATSSLIDSYTVEIPLLYKKNVYDLAGFSLGVTNQENMLPRIDEVHEGDVVIGIPSSGVHSNGFSLIHKIMDFAGVSLTDKTPFGTKTFAEEFLTPTKIYVNAVKPLLARKCIKALAHITGGGLLENIPRVLRKDLGVELDARNFNILPIFAWLAENGNVACHEMLRTYNCGLGLVLIVDPKHVKYVMEELHFSHKASNIGTVVQRKSTNTPQVVINNFEKCLSRVQKVLKTPKKRVAVLISGSGTNLQALIDATRDSTMGTGAEIVLVLSNKDEIFGLRRAADADIPAYVISHKQFKSREQFDEAMTKKLEEFKIDIICLAGFMRILSEKFVKRWKGKLINIHPSLLPKHPGLHVQQKAIDAGDSESGCTIHFVDEGVDTGAIIIQESVPILPNDDEESLTKRIQKAEHYAFPKALRLVATEEVSLGVDGSVIFS